MTREYHAPRGHLAAVAVALVCVAASVTPAAAGFVCGDACPKPPTPTYPYNNFSSPVTPNQVQLTQALYAAVPKVPATPSAAQEVFVRVILEAAGVAQQFSTETLPSMLANCVDVVSDTQAGHQTVAVTLPALLTQYAKTTNQQQKDSILSSMQSQALGLHQVASSAATAASNGNQANQAIQDAVASFVAGTNSVTSACAAAPDNILTVQAALKADMAAFDACTTPACRSKAAATVASTLQDLATQKDLVTLCSSSSWPGTLSSLLTSVQNFNYNVPNSLRVFFSLRESALSSAASDASRLANNFTPSSFNATLTKSLLSDVVAQLAFSMGPCYHLALTACPAMCPPSTLA